MGLRVRRADTAPGVGASEYFGRTPESVLTDRDCSLGAKAMFGVIALAMAQANNRTVCLTTVGELGRLLGVEIRQARRLVAELERRGHVTRERIRTISGSPQGIRPTATLKPPRTRSDPTDCNRSHPAERPVKPGTAPGQIRPSARSRMTGASIKRVREEKEVEIVAGAVGVRGEPARPPAAPEPQTPEEIRAAWKAAGVDIEAIGQRARKSPGGPSAKNPPRGRVQGIPGPDAKDCTPQPPNPSRPESTKLT